MGCTQTATSSISERPTGACSNCGPADLVVPNVVGQSVIDADRMLSNAKMLCRSASVVNSATVGTVVSQQPPPGSKVQQYSVVTVKYAVTVASPPRIDEGCAHTFGSIYGRVSVG
jgi:beta-lactam-binding protein with PASTA domain